ncbi:MAG: peptide chain release factor 2 [Elusimicrobiaceae bacterium]|jgi:peptide chain release factor 2|nr:peptide chain release factor 2 [Elusimicrobiaceae bacterium]MBT3955220.1 peptide chain release factor 2 [Elusimicrobiaceae bacterium]MBT4007789.1 peptide chain release factor 2 [Elusimicrobiaceae bacterium]MBT4403318.1 peptide chain release factor 2 [Elusimicrobiaceae bacterium]MBT4440376.1 peptide chain release factor 2 [Elusimicrobiaceae bacterium]
MVEHKEIENKIKKISTKLLKVEKLANISDKIILLEKEEQKTNEEGFWNDNKKAKELLKKIDILKKDIENFNTAKKLLEDGQTLFELVGESGSKKDIAEIISSLEKAQGSLAQIEFALKLSHPNDKLNAILHINAGAGGTESCDWAQMLLRMYQRWSQQKGFKFTITDVLNGEEAGIKSASVFIEGAFAYGYLKSEIGVHRLVRVSPFDSAKRRHTSFASCDVLPDIEDSVEIEVNDSDLKIDTYRSGGAGGQNVNKVETAVRITHIPSGVIVACQIERSQLANKITAMKMLKAKLYEIELDKKRSEQEKHYGQKSDIGWGNQIRSYVFMPYQMVKDLRTNFETSQIENVLNGDLDGFMNAYLDYKVK